MATVNEKLTDLQVSHALHNLKAANGIDRDLQRILKNAEDDLVGLLGKRLAKIAVSGDTSKRRTERLTNLIAEVRGLYGKVYSQTGTELTAALKEIALNEGEWQADALRTAIPVNVTITTPAPAVLTQLATGSVVNGLSLATSIDALSAGTVMAVERAVNTGIIAGQSVDDIVRGVLNNGLDLPRKKLRQMTRTAVMQVANDAAHANYAANERILKGWQFVATLDLRTCAMCAAYDGQMFKIGEGPRPPLHPNSRSISIPVVKSYDELGIDRAEYSNKVRASMDGQIASPRNMESWLKGQSVARQEAILGKTKAKLWRDGKFRLSDFVRDDRTIISLDELRKLKPAAFAD
ncbi:phage putative head morphogenesis protein [Novosphingobium sp. Rr 2-17]|uniref:phage head morphogenesis protein n=1 Tax=Novosphingobium sp. Rr 2-17 TaxID=555793 RepID=UPI0002698890|nr:phage head morphogenesis protein [Novosphingobium sp. Rr 2-17]EIZ79225.1 phage putative head morphogenesis protein [Novosphingobium sp. Rr 2-17]